jgi:hypothetical protein
MTICERSKMDDLRVRFAARHWAENCVPTTLAHSRLSESSAVAAASASVARLRDSQNHGALPVPLVACR